MKMIDEHKFVEFDFNELREMVLAIAKTKHKSREGVWKNGYGLESIDHLESHIDEILEEMALRIREAFSVFRIQSNFKHNKLPLPPDLLNLNNINATQLNAMLYRNPDLVGSETNEEGDEEIYILFNDIKYKMQKNGQIVVS
jgi:hypothetical protein